MIEENMFELFSDEEKEIIIKVLQSPKLYEVSSDWVNYMEIYKGSDRCENKDGIIKGFKINEEHVEFATALFMKFGIRVN